MESQALSVWLAWRILVDRLAIYGSDSVMEIADLDAWLSLENRERSPEVTHFGVTVSPDNAQALLAFERDTNATLKIVNASIGQQLRACFERAEDLALYNLAYA